MYDGCSEMIGHFTGATQLRQIEPTALQVHCFAHSQKHCLQDAAKYHCFFKAKISC